MNIASGIDEPERRAIPSRAIAARNGPYAWYVAIVLAFANSLAIMDRYLLGLVQEPLKHHFLLSDTQLGLLQGPGFMILYCAVAIPVGWFADVGSRRMIIAGGIFFWSVATGSMAIANSFRTLLAARAALGIGEAALVPAAMSLVAAYFTADRLARASSLLNVGGYMGAIFAFFGCGALLSYLTAHHVRFFGHVEPWQALFMICVVPGLMLCALMSTITEPARDGIVASHKQRLIGALRYIWVNSAAFGFFAGAAVAVAILSSASAAWATSLFVRAHGLSVPSAGVLIGIVILAAGPLGSLAVGWVTDRLTARGVRGSPAIVVAGGLALAALPTVLFTQSHQLGWSIVGFGGLQSLLGMPIYAGLQMLAPKRYLSTVSSLFMVILVLLGSGTGPLVVGLMADHVFTGSSRLSSSLLTTLLLAEMLGSLLALAGRAHFDRTAAPVLRSDLANPL